METIHDFLDTKPHDGRVLGNNGAHSENPVEGQANEAMSMASYAHRPSSVHPTLVPWGWFGAFLATTGGFPVPQRAPFPALRCFESTGNTCKTLTIGGFISQVQWQAVAGMCYNRVAFLLTL